MYHRNMITYSIYRTTWHHDPEYQHLYPYRRENIKTAIAVLDELLL